MFGNVFVRLFGISLFVKKRLGTSGKELVVGRVRRGLVSRVVDVESFVFFFRYS